MTAHPLDNVRTAHLERERLAQDYAHADGQLRTAISHARQAGYSYGRIAKTMKITRAGVRWLEQHQP